MELQRGQVAVITGGASGIGLAMATSFAARGLDVVVADVDAEPMAAAVELLEGRGVSAMGMHTDVREASHLDALAAATLERFGRVDVICNNAGVVSPMKPIWEVDLRDWEWVLAVNLLGVIHGMRSFVPHLIAQGSGHVVNTASMAGIAVIPSLGPYSAAKFGVVGLSEMLAVELVDVAPAVGVTVVCPGMIESNLGAAERNRPSVLASGQDSADPDPQPAPSVTSVPRAGVLPAVAVGEAVVAAIEANVLHIAPNGSLPLVRRRIDRLLADLSAPVYDDPT
jgi:NAD(P)-dependent dehydrogenase (short-subunit alcohol dehydrogenase family)